MGHSRKIHTKRHLDEMELPEIHSIRDMWTYVDRLDVEKHAGDSHHLSNTTIKNFVWKDLTVTVKDNKTGKPKRILTSVEGCVKAGKPSRLYSPFPKLMNLFSLRRVGRPHGPLWLWENHFAQCSR
jgi:hypothetical protein